MKLGKNIILISAAVLVLFLVMQKSKNGTEESVGIGGRRYRRKRDKWTRKLCRYCRNNPQGCNAPTCQGAVECGC